MRLTFILDIAISRNKFGNHLTVATKKSNSWSPIECIIVFDCHSFPQSLMGDIVQLEKSQIWFNGDFEIKSKHYIFILVSSCFDLYLGFSG